MRTCLRAAALFCLSVCLPSVAFAQVGEVSVALWTPTPSFVLSTEDLAAANLNNVDFVKEFGLENKRFPEFRAVFGRSHKARISYVLFEYDAEATIQRTFTFRGRTFNIGAPATAEVEWRLWKFGYEWDFVSRPQGFVGIIADLKYNEVRAKIDSPALSAAAETETKAWVPTVGAIARGYISPAVAVTAEVTGLRINSDEFLAKYIDFDVNGIIFFGRNVGAQGGYRSVDVEYLIDEDRGNLRMRGPYFGGVIKF